MISKSRHLPLLLTAVALALAVILSSCGGSEEDTAQATVTKAVFIREADQICSASDKAQEDKLAELGEEVKQTGKPLGDEELIQQAGLPPLGKAIEELSQLQLPADGGGAEAIIVELEAALETAEQNPKSLLNSTSPFTPVAAKARAYGFKVCGTP
jgi:hypothetical protein